MKRFPRQQRTIRRPVRLAGIGYWTGDDVTVEFRPALPDSGITFVRCDVAPVCRIRARIDHRALAQRRTTLAKGEISVEMVEHIMAALAGLQIDNCEVWVNAAEMPAWDGSSQTPVQALTAAGIIRQDFERDVVVIRHPFRIGDSDSWIAVEPAPRSELIFQYELDYGQPSPIGRQWMEYRFCPSTFRTDIAPARTFLLDVDAQDLRSRGLGMRTTYHDLLVFDHTGPIHNSLRFPDECVRHKILDMIGDLALLEADIHGRITAYRSGHRLNAELVRHLREIRIGQTFRKSA